MILCVCRDFPSFSKNLPWFFGVFYRDFLAALPIRHGLIRYEDWLSGWMFCFWYRLTRVVLDVRAVKQWLLSISGVMLLHDNAPVHKSYVQAAILLCGFLEMNNPPYSQDVAPSHFLFRYLQKHFCGCWFSSNTFRQIFSHGWKDKVEPTTLYSGETVL